MFKVMKYTLQHRQKLLLIDRSVTLNECVLDVCIQFSLPPTVRRVDLPKFIAIERWQTAMMITITTIIIIHRKMSQMYMYGPYLHVWKMKPISKIDMSNC